jgi:hypothetical protein
MSDEQWIVRLAEEKRLLKNYRGRRLQACRAVDTLCDVIDNHRGCGPHELQRF